ncbi:hypothetical protein D9M72_501650 [compost metagenome]
MVGGIGRQHHALAVGIEAEHHVTRRMTEGGDGRDTGHDLGAVADESRLLRQRHYLLQHRLVPVFRRRACSCRVLPEGIFGFTHHVAGIGECRLAGLHEAADVIAVHMGHHHDRDLLRRIAGGADAFGKAAHTGLAAALAHAGIEEHDIRSGIDENRRETVDQRFGRQKVLLQQFRHRLLRLVGAIDLMRFLGDACAVIDHDDLEGSELERSDRRSAFHVRVFRLFLSHRSTCQQRRRREHPRRARPHQGPALHRHLTHGPSHFVALLNPVAPWTTGPEVAS